MPMKRIVFCTFGSLGDIYPLLALAREPRLTRLGIARSVPRERYDARIAAGEIRALLWDEGYTNRANDVGLRVQSETGTSTACDLLEQLTGHAGSLTAEFRGHILAH